MDGSIRSLERALAAGDEQVRLPLATAYQRLGRAAEAISLLATLPDPEALALSEGLWAEELRALRPARRIPGARPYGELWGWAGARPVLLESLLERNAPLAARLLGVVDFALGDFCWELPPRVPHVGRPVGADSEQILTTGEAPGTFRRHRIASPGAEPERGVLAEEGQVVATDRALMWAALSLTAPGRRELHLYRLADGALGRVAHSGPRARLSWAVDWEQSRFAWLDGEALRLGDLAGVEPGRELRQARIGPGTRLEALLGDYALLSEPLQLVALEGGERVELPRVRGHGPWRLSRDGRLLLGYRLGLPVAMPLGGVALRSPTLAPPRGLSRAFWHPHVPVVAVGRADEGTELRHASGAVVTTLPRDAHPLGWRPDGRGLVVVRRLGPVSGLLELWTPGGAPPCN